MQQQGEITTYFRIHERMFKEKFESKVSFFSPLAYHIKYKSWRYRKRVKNFIVSLVYIVFDPYLFTSFKEKNKKFEWQKKIPVPKSIKFYCIPLFFSNVFSCCLSLFSKPMAIIKLCVRRVSKPKGYFFAITQMSLKLDDIC